MLPGTTSRFFPLLRMQHLGHHQRLYMWDVGGAWTNQQQQQFFFLSLSARRDKQMCDS